MKYFIGDNVKYEGDIWRIFKINGDIISITNGDSEAEVLKGEVDVIYDMDFEPYDYGYMLDCERIMLRQMYDFFTKESMLCDRDDIARHISLAINLLNIVLAYDDPLVMEYNDSSEDGDVILRMDVYVNTRNATRFLRYNIGHPMLKNELRKEKAWYLYNRLRYYYLQQIWE